MILTSLNVISVSPSLSLFSLPQPSAPSFAIANQSTSETIINQTRNGDAKCNIPKEYYYYLINKFQNKINITFNIKPFPKNTGKFKTVYNVIITGVHNNKTKIKFKWLP